MSICKKCGQEVDGILAWANHPCNGTTVEYRVYTKNEVRIAFMEMGMPTMGFEAMDLEPPTEMERIIYEDTKP